MTADKELKTHSCSNNNTQNMDDKSELKEKIMEYAHISGDICHLTKVLIEITESEICSQEQRLSLLYVLEEKTEDLKSKLGNLELFF